jgi:co-chaperonin GroES (HSP10)
MGIKALGHRLSIRPDKFEELDENIKSAKAAGIIVEVESRDREQKAVDTGIVIDIGFSAFRDFTGETKWCQIGDHVAYAKYSGKWVKDPVTGEEILIINDEDIICALIHESE